MVEITIPQTTEPRTILQTIIEKKTPSVMSCLANGSWYITKILLTGLGANILNAIVLSTQDPTNIQVDQPVGISTKYEYGKFIFESTIVSSELPSEPTSHEMILFKVPDRIETIQRRHYYRVNAPSSMKVNVALWHRSDIAAKRIAPPKNYWQGRLVDISAGGLQIAIDTKQASESSNTADFKKGQCFGLRFTPMPYETPLMFDARIRNILPTASGKSTCLGLQIISLESSPKGRHTLQRLCNVVEQYYQIAQSDAKQQLPHPTNLITANHTG